MFLNSHLHLKNTATTKDAELLFRGIRSGHVGHLQYGTPMFDGDKVMGADLWTDMRFAPNYYLAREDDALLTTVVGELQEIGITCDTLIDLGPGDDAALHSKTIPLLKGIKARNYLAVDMAIQYAQQSAAKVAEFCDVSSESALCNFLENSLNRKTDNALMFMGGSTISNMPIDIHVKHPILQLSAQLAKLRYSVSGNSYLLIGFDANQDDKSLYDSYQFDTHARLIEDILWRIQRDAYIGLEPESVEYRGEWLKSEHRFAHNVVFKEDSMVWMGSDTRSFKKGDLIHLDNSYKFPAELMQRAAQSAGWSNAGLWSATGRASYILLQAKD